MKSTSALQGKVGQDPQTELINTIRQRVAPIAWKAKQNAPISEAEMNLLTSYFYRSLTSRNSGGSRAVIDVLLPISKYQKLPELIVTYLNFTKAFDILNLDSDSKIILQNLASLEAATKVAASSPASNPALTAPSLLTLDTQSALSPVNALSASLVQIKDSVTQPPNSKLEAVKSKITSDQINRLLTLTGEARIRQSRRTLIFLDGLREDTLPVNELVVVLMECEFEPKTRQNVTKMVYLLGKKELPFERSEVLTLASLLDDKDLIVRKTIIDLFAVLPKSDIAPQRIEKFFEALELEELRYNALKTLAVIVKDNRQLILNLPGRVIEHFYKAFQEIIDRKIDPKKPPLASKVIDPTEEILSLYKTIDELQEKNYHENELFRNIVEILNALDKSRPRYGDFIASLEQAILYPEIRGQAIGGLYQALKKGDRELQSSTIALVSEWIKTPSISDSVKSQCGALLTILAVNKRSLASSSIQDIVEALSHSEEVIRNWAIEALKQLAINQKLDDSITLSIAKSLIRGSTRASAVQTLANAVRCHKQLLPELAIEELTKIAADKDNAFTLRKLALQTLHSNIINKGKLPNLAILVGNLSEDSPEIAIFLSNIFKVSTDQAKDLSEEAGKALQSAVCELESNLIKQEKGGLIYNGLAISILKNILANINLITTPYTTDTLVDILSDKSGPITMRQNAAWTVAFIISNQMPEELPGHIIECLEDNLKSQDREITQACIFALSKYSKSSKGAYLGSQLIDSLSENNSRLYTLTIDILQTLATKGEKLPEKALNVLGWLIIEHQDKEIRTQSFTILSLASNNQPLSKELTNILRLEECSRYLVDENKEKATKAIEEVISAAEGGQKLSKNCFSSLEKIIKGGDEDLVSYAARAIEYGAINGQNIPVSLIASINDRISASKSNFYLINALATIIQESGYSSQKTVITFETLIAENQENAGILEHSTNILKLLTERGQPLTEKGTLALISLIINPKSTTRLITNSLQTLDSLVLSNESVPDIAVSAAIEALISEDKQVQIYSSLLLKHLGEQGKIELSQENGGALLKLLASNVDPGVEVNLYAAILSFKQSAELDAITKRIAELNKLTLKSQDTDLSIEERNQALQKIYELGMTTSLPRNTVLALKQLMPYDDLRGSCLLSFGLLAEKGQVSFLTSEDLEIISISLNNKESASNAASILSKVAVIQKLPDYALDQIGHSLVESEEGSFRETLKEILQTSAKHQALSPHLSNLLSVGTDSVISQEEAENIRVATTLIDMVKAGNQLSSSNLELLEQLLQTPNIAPIIIETAIWLIKHRQPVTEVLIDKAIDHSTEIITGDDQVGILKALNILRLIQEGYKSLPSSVIANIEDLLANEEPEINKAAFTILRQEAANESYHPSDKFWAGLGGLLSKVSPDLLAAGVIDKLAEEEDISIILAVVDHLLTKNDLTAEIVTQFPPQKWNREALRIKLLNAVAEARALEVSEIENFAANLELLEEFNDYPDYSPERDQVLEHLISWQAKDHLGIRQLNELLGLLKLGHDKAIFAIASYDLDSVREIWVQDRLEYFLPHITFASSHIKSIAARIAESNLDINGLEQLFSLAQDLKSPEQIISILELAAKHKIPQEYIDKILDSNFDLELTTQRLEHAILEHQLYKYCTKINDFTHQNILQRELSRLLENGWALETITLLLESIGPQDLGYFKASLKIINDYQIPEKAVDARSVNIAEIFQKVTPSNWLLELNKHVVKVSYGSEGREKELNALIQELEQSNNNNQAILELITSGLLKQQFANVIAAFNKDSTFQPREKAIAQWSKEDISQWASKVKQDKAKAVSESFLPEMIAVIKRAAIIATGNDPRSIQILAILTLLATKDKGRLAQISTGEGKSMTSAMLSSIKALQGEKVDVVTSSPILAERDSMEWQEFYEMLELTVSHNIEPASEKTIRGICGLKRCYLSDIVYGDVGNFQYDLLRHEYKLLETRGDRPFGTVIVDEVDSMMIDESSKIAKLSSHMPCSEYLEPVYTAAWHELNRLDKHFHYLKNKDQWIWVEDNFKEEGGEIVLLTENQDSEDNIVEVANISQFRIDHLKYYLTRIIRDSEDSGIIVPSHLREFALSQAESWAKSAIAAKNMVEKRDYLIIRDRLGESNIAPVDYHNTGIVQANTNWSNGLHQFLQIKHSLKIRAESLTTSFISNMGYFRRYGNKIFGMTGTLGSYDNQELLANVYNIDLAFIPTYKQKQFIELPGIVTETPEEWLTAVATTVEEEANKQRAVLVICETIQDVELVETKLLAGGYSADKIKRYSRSDNEEHLSLGNNIDCGEIIIATNLAGRGTDIKTTKSVEDNGGLHVCVTFMPANLRVEQQAFGRTSRQGKKGTGQLVIDKFHTLGNLGTGNYRIDGIDELKNLRNQVEQDRIKRVRLEEVARIINDDWLFSEFCQFTHSLNSREENKGKLMQLEENWGMWLKGFQEQTNTKNRNKTSSSLLDTAALYGFKCQTLEQNSDSLYLAVSYSLKHQQSAQQLKATAIAYLLDSKKITLSNFPLPAGSQLPPLLTSSSRPVIPKLAVDRLISQNAFNQKGNPNYWYQATDIAAIQSQIMHGFQRDFNIHQPIGDRQDLNLILQQLISSATQERPTLSIYNKGNNHWVAFAVIITGDAPVVLYKDSKGETNELLKQKLLLLNDKTMFLANKNKEQVFGVDCGIFALQNLYIMAQKIQGNREGFIKEFEDFGGFCPLKLARDLRKNEFAAMYALGRYHDMVQESKKLAIYSALRKNHQQEVLEIAEIMRQEPKLRGQIIRVLGADENIVGQLQNTISLEIGLTEFNDNSYNYCYRIGWSKDINPENELQEFITAKAIGTISLDKANRVIRIAPRVAVPHLDISRIVVAAAEINIQTLYDNLSIVQSSSSQEEVSALLKKAALPYVERSQVSSKEESAARESIPSASPTKASVVTTPSAALGQVANQITDEDKLEALSISLNASIIVIFSDGSSPKIIKRANCREIICLGYEGASGMLKPRYWPLTASSMQPIEDITELFDAAPENTKDELVTIEDPASRGDVRQVLYNLELQELLATREINEEKRKQALAKYNLFKEQQEAEYFASNKIIKNPAYLIMEAFNKMKDDYRLSIEWFGESINLDRVYNFSAYYNKAYATIREGAIRAERAGTNKVDRSYQVEAAQDLLAAKAQIEQYIIPQLQAMQIIAPQIGNNPLSRQIVDKIDLYKMLIKHIDEVINIISNCDANNFIKISSTKLIASCYTESYAPTAEISELNYMGVNHIFAVEEVAPVVSMLDAITVAVIGAVQIGVGIMGVMSGNPALIASSISNIIAGIQDLAKAAAIANGEPLNWKNYLTEKGIEIGVKLATMGLERAYSAAKINQAALTQGMKEAAAKGLSGEAAKKYAAEFVKAQSKQLLIQEVPKLVGKELVTAVFKEAGVKLVHYGITSSINHLAKEHLKDCRGEIEGGVRKRLNGLFENPSTQQQLNHILAIDHFNQNPKFQRHLMLAATDLLQQKSSVLNRFASSLCEALMFNSNVHPVISGGAAAAKTAEIAHNISQILDLADEFCTKLSEKIAATEQSLPNIAMALYQKLTPRINQSDAVKIMEILQQNGVLKSQYEFNKSLMGFLSGFGVYKIQPAPRTLFELPDLSQASSSPAPKVVKIDQVDFGEYNNYKAEIIELCHNLHKSLITDHSNLREQMASDLSSTVTCQIMARIQGQVVSPIASGIANVASRDVTEKLLKFGSDVMRSTSETLGQSGKRIKLDLKERQALGVAAGDEARGGILDQLFKSSRKKAKPDRLAEESKEQKKTEIRAWSALETELYTKYGVNPDIDFDPVVIEQQAKLIGKTVEWVQQHPEEAINLGLNIASLVLVPEVRTAQSALKTVVTVGKQIPGFVQNLRIMASKNKVAKLELPVTGTIIESSVTTLGSAGSKNITTKPLPIQERSSVIIKPLKAPKPDMGEYRLTKGHHVYSKKAFEGHVNYDPKKGFSISHGFMKSKGWRHEDMTVAQRQLYGELYISGRPNTLQEHTRVAVEALKKAGASRQEARDIVAQGLLQLRKDKVKEPISIPWYTK